MPSPVLPPVFSMDSFPRHWQGVCRAALTRYCEHPDKIAANRPMGMTRLRNEIMTDFDGWDAGIRVPDRSLMREDLEHWMSGKTYLSTTKFQYIDRWIRLNRRKYPLSEVLYGLVEYKEAQNRKTFSELYCRDYEDGVDDVDGVLSALSRGVVFSEILKAPEAASADPLSRVVTLSDFRQIILHFKDYSEKSISVSAVYIDTPISDLNPNPEKRMGKLLRVSNDSSSK